MEFIKYRPFLFIGVLLVSAVAIWLGWEFLGEVKDSGWEVLMAAREFVWNFLGEARDFIADNRGKVIGTSLMALAVAVVVAYVVHKASSPYP